MIKLGTLVIAVLIALAPATQATAQTPNIVLIMLDDLGKEGLGTFYRRTYKTPNIDALANQGTRFSRFYANPVCTPTRASLLTGLYPPRTGWTSNESATRKCLEPEFGTFVQRLRESGYVTGAAGKWHICPFDLIEGHPDALGFDTWMISNMVYWGGQAWVDGVKASYAETTYMPDEYAGFAVEFIRANAGRPFFLYFAPTLPHKLWVETPDTLSKPWATPGSADKRHFPHMVNYADKLVGQIIRETRRQGLEQNTVVIFLTDNGTASDLPSGGKHSTSDAGVNVPMIIKWPGVAEPGTVRHSITDITDIYPTILEMAGLAQDDKDGQSLVSALDGDLPGHKWAYSQMGEKFSLRHGIWKLRENDELYNLLDDPLERHPFLPYEDTPQSAKARRVIEGVMIEQGFW